MYLTKKQYKLGLSFVASAEEIFAGFMWYDYGRHIDKYGDLLSKGEPFTKEDVQDLKIYMKQTIKDYNKFIVSIGEKGLTTTK